MDLMTPEHWAHIRLIFETALELTGDAQIQYLDKACKGDSALMEEIRSLLRAERDVTPFLDEPLQWASTLISRDELPACVGPYRVLQLLGQGGMGTVYLAERDGDSIQKPVALKLLDQLHLASRFEQEQLILKHLNHPGIARLIDAGFVQDMYVAQDTYGNINARPYLVMEYVEGEPIGRYVTKRDLPVEDRLKLFIQVCHAVQYAHENLVLHRDIKPSNILVGSTHEGHQVKLLDFGIAKLLDQSQAGEAPMTRTGQFLLTPEYASPEQLLGKAAATPSDVYSLGVLLFELLTDQRPYNLQGLSPREIEGIVCDTSPPKMSAVAGNEQLRKRLRGDLDTIVIKALQKEPGRRYRTVAEMKEDLQRHLDHLPVKARPDTKRYRLLKFTRRHRTGVTATLIVILTLLGGIVATTMQTRIARRNSQQIRMLTSALLSDIDLAIRDLPGATKAREQLVTTAVRFLDSLQQQTPKNRILQLDMAAAYDQLARLQGDPHYSNLGWLTEARQNYQKAFNIRKEIWARDSLDAGARHALAISFGHLGVMDSWMGNNEQAIAHTTRALHLLRQNQHNPDPDANRYKYDIARIQSELGWWLIWYGRIDEGINHLQEAMPALEALAVANPDDLDLQLQRWCNYWYQTDGLKFTARYDEAHTLLEKKARPFLENLASRYPTNPRVQYALHTIHFFLGEINLALDDTTAARNAFELSSTIAEQMVISDATNRKGFEGLAFGNAAMARLHFERGEYKTAIPFLQKNVDLREQLFKQDEGNMEAANALSSSRRMLCRAYLLDEQLTLAISQCSQAITQMTAVLQGTPVKGIIWGNQGFNYGWLARAYTAQAAREQLQEVRTSSLARALNFYNESLSIMEAFWEQQKGIDDAWEFSLETLRSEQQVIEGLLEREGH